MIFYLLFILVHYTLQRADYKIISPAQMLVHYYTPNEWMYSIRSSNLFNNFFVFNNVAEVTDIVLFTPYYNAKF